MSNYLRWTQHPKTLEWHHAYWMDDHFGPHHYGVMFNDGLVFSPRDYDLETLETPPEDETVNTDRDFQMEIFGRPEGAPDPRDAKMELIEVGKLANIVDEFLENNRPLTYTRTTIDEQIKDAAWDVFQSFWQFLNDKASGQEPERKNGL